MPESNPRGRSRIFEAMAGVLGRIDVRVVLSIAIIVSLLPFEWVGRLDSLFLVLFGLEFLLRATLLFRGEAIYIYAKPNQVELLRSRDDTRGWHWPKSSALILLVFDLFALLSFLPIQVEGSAATRWLRMFRLSRMLLLISYWAPLVRDAWGVLLRGERAKQIVLMGFIVLVLSFSGAVVIEHVGAGEGRPIDFDGDGKVGDNDRRFFVHLWWAFRQVQDPGNMLSSPGEAAVVIVSLALTVVGLFMVSFLIGLGTDVVRELMELTRMRPPGLRGHTIVVNIDPSTQQLLHMLMRYSRKLKPDGRFSLGWVRKLLRNTTARGLGSARFVVAGDGASSPDFLRQPDLVDIVYRQARVEDDTFVIRTDTISAQRVVLLADFTAPDPDAETIQAVLTITQSLAETDTRRRDPHERKRLLIAEILDESNVPAARRAISAGDRQNTRAFVIPSERLIALFIACITRRPGCERLLEELLTSSGHELYTCFFDEEGLGYCEKRRPALGERPEPAMVELGARARALRSRHRVVPVGLFFDSKAGEEPDVFINPRVRADAGASELPARSCGGFIAIAANFNDVCALSRSLFEAKLEPTSEPPSGPLCHPELSLAKTTPLRRVLICGFRSATVSMVEALIKSEPHTQILIMVADAAARDHAIDDFDAHSRLIERKLLRGSHGRFRKAKDQALLTWLDPEAPDAERGPHVYLAIGDWTSSRQLTALPLGFGSVAKLDAVVMVSSEREGSDARTAKTLMKLETLVDPPRSPRVVAEVLDVDLARRLRRRAAQLGDTCTMVYSIQELRAFFMFQAVVVPAFDQVYAELMGPWGQSLVKLDAKAGAGTCSFDALADHVATRGQVLVALELDVGKPQTQLLVAEGSAIDLAKLRSVWVVAEDHPRRPHSVIG
ncbi:hypothetical protein ACNOYE_24875 [Nannocystaceae bacterium ST9]